MFQVKLMFQLKMFHLPFFLSYLDESICGSMDVFSFVSHKTDQIAAKLLDAKMLTEKKDK